MYCTYYRKNDHIKNKCYNKYSHLKKAKQATAKPGINNVKMENLSKMSKQTTIVMKVLILYNPN